VSEWFDDGGPDIKQLRKDARLGRADEAAFSAGVIEGIDWVRQEARRRHDHEQHRSVMGLPTSYEACQFTVCRYVKSLLHD